jgi:hypothetical protein
MKNGSFSSRRTMSAFLVPDKAVLRIPDPYFCHPRSQIPDPGSKNSNKKRGTKKTRCPIFFCRHKYHKIENYLIFKLVKKEFGPIYKEL